MNKDNIGKNLKEIIDYLDITQTELAQMTGLTQAGISQIINNERTPSVDSIILILKALNIKFERLLK